jgi:periplasmic divalent cation tolerance protein
MAFVAFFVTYPDAQSAERSARTLLERKVVACANWFPIKSAYWWKGRIEEAGEVLVIFKTIAERANDVEEAIVAIHPYEVPAIERVEVSANASFEEWLRAVCE